MQKTYPAWDRTLPPSSTLGAAQRARGLSVVRGIIHLHSVYSHDACDYDPQPQGMPNQPCYDHLRQGLCTTNQDFAFLTDHSAFMSSTPWDTLFVQNPGDQPVLEQGLHTGSLLQCDQASGNAGHQVLLTVGSENSLMPVGLTGPVGSTDAERAANMTEDDAAAVQRFRAAGAVVLQAHGEGYPLALLRQLADGGLGGMEVYNLHANVDPTIRSMDLGESADGAILGLAPWLTAKPVAKGGPEPDLAILGFLEENLNQIGKYETLLGDGHHLSSMIGSDIHENTVPDLLSDGERGDSYRRLMRWFSNHLLVPQGAPLTPAGLKAALAGGRLYSVFEVFGEPMGFDYYAQTASGTAEMGDTIYSGTLHLKVPVLTVPAGTSADNQPLLHARVLYVAPGATAGTAVLDRSLSAEESGQNLDLTYAATYPGAYRAVIYVQPRHLQQLLGAQPAPYMKEYQYLYTNPIYVAAAPGSESIAPPGHVTLGRRAPGSPRHARSR